MQTTIVMNAHKTLDSGQLAILGALTDYAPKQYWITVNLYERYESLNELSGKIWIYRVDRITAAGKVLKDRNGDFKDVTF